jgi:hypothetical protein
VTGGRRFFSNYGAYLGDLYFRSLDVRTNVWGKIVYQDSREFFAKSAGKKMNIGGHS